MDNADDKIRVLQAINNMRLKTLVTISILVAFFVILAFVCFAKTWEDRAVFGALDGILGGTMYPLTNHFFPAYKEARASERRTKTKK
jgi:hypothetical protein